MSLFRKSFILAFIGFLSLVSLAHASFNNNVKYGTRNSDFVREIQKFLTDQGVYSGPITGNFYALTLKGVKAFQNREGIKPANGYWGPGTRDVANRLLDTSESDNEALGEDNAPTSDNIVAIRFPDGSTYNSNGKQLSGPTPIDQNFANDLCNNFAGVQLVPPAGYMPASNGDCVIIPPNVVYIPTPVSNPAPQPIQAPTPTPTPVPQPIFLPIPTPSIGVNCQITYYSCTNTTGKSIVVKSVKVTSYMDQGTSTGKLRLLNEYGQDLNSIDLVRPSNYPVGTYTFESLIPLSSSIEIASDSSKFVVKTYATFVRVAKVRYIIIVDGIDKEYLTQINY